MSQLRDTEWTVRNTTQIGSASGFSPVCGIPSRGNSGASTKEHVLVLEPKTKTKRPPFFRVIMMNDDYTPMEFVVEVLKKVFRHQHEEAISLMLQIHHKGQAIVGVFTRDVAETKIDLAMQLARQHEYPLQCVIERD